MKIAVGMSGGVDSAVAALLLKEQGFDVVGYTMDLGREGEEISIQKTREVADKLGMELKVLDFRDEWRLNVSDYIRSSYLNAETPNPCVRCNECVKMFLMPTAAFKDGFERFATGHYARADGDGRLFRGKDRQKDQSYFLYMLKEAQLEKALFPVGQLTKPEIRRIAEEHGLPVFQKKDSTGVCFIGERNFRQFLQNYLPTQPGDMRTEDGEKVGEHMGLMYYTLGQRRGLGIGGRGDGRSWFVVEKDLARNVLVVAQGEDSPRLYANRIRASQPTWIADQPPMGEGESIRLTARFRYRQPDQAVTVTRLGDELLIAADELQRAITPGQSVVFYQGDVCLGGAIEEEAWMAQD